MSAIWFICFFTIFFLFPLLFSRNKFVEKPNRIDVRQTPLYEPRSLLARFRLFSLQLDEEFPREDIIYGALRRINSGLTCRRALSNPLGMFLIICFLSVALTILIISLSTTISQVTARNQLIHTVD